MVYFLFVHYPSKVISVTNIHVEANNLGFKHKTQSKYKNHGNSKYAAQKILIRKNLASIFRIYSTEVMLYHYLGGRDLFLYTLEMNMTTTDTVMQ